jgi:putative photosynthetic complex assembly protein
MHVFLLFSRVPTTIKAALICFFISFIGFSLTKYFSGEKESSVITQPVTKKVLKFEDHQDGSVLVIDAKSNQIIDVIHGEAGFIRGVLRTVTRERKMRGIADHEPVELSAYNDGRIVLQDPYTNTKIELRSFGAGNAMEFKAFLMKSNS